MKKISEILRGVSVLQSTGTLDTEVAALTFDSRKVAPKTCFFAIKGTQADGHAFIPKAIELGAAVVVCEMVPTALEPHVTYVQVDNAAAALGLMAAAFYDHPSEKMTVVGVTGTNGKTSTATLLYDLFTGLGHVCGLVSTVENRVAGRVLPSTHTTPDQIALQALFADMRSQGVTHVFMEVSSHALSQNRVAGVHFSGAVFSNITHDHLDYHKTFDAYIKAKKSLFDQLPKTAFALTNHDDRNGRVMLQNTKAKTYSYALKKLSDFRGKIIDNGLLGLEMEIDGRAFHARMIGEFNAYNLLAVYATAVLLGQEPLAVLTVLSGLKGAEGRFEYIHDPKRDIVGIVDYAHTPDALENVLKTIHILRKQQQRIITLTGAGGDRDPAKREFMGKIGAEWSNILILTADNPRTEDPVAIIQQMKKALTEAQLNHVLEIPDRRAAIKTAVNMAQKGDIILLAGKGHEKYQEINGVKHPFDDKEELLKLFSAD